MGDGQPQEISDDAKVVGRDADTETAVSGWSDMFAEGQLSRFVLVCFGVWLAAVDSQVTTTIMPSVGAELGGYACFGWTVAGSSAR